MATRTSRWLALPLIVAAAVLSSCAPTHPAPAPPTTAAAQFPHWPAVMNEVRFVWTAAPDVDLESDVVVAIRAYYESRELAELTQDLDNVYPGFYRAVSFLQPTLSPDRAQDNNPGPFVGVFRPPKPEDHREPLWGNVHFRILSLSQPHADTQAIVCINADYLYKQTAPNQYVLIEPTPFFRLERLDVSDRDPRTGPHPPASPTLPQRGPQPAPLEDVFGPWHVQGMSLAPGLRWYGPDGTLADTPGADGWTRQCRDGVPLPVDQRPGAFPPRRDTPPPFQPAVPGWPGPTQ